MKENKDFQLKVRLTKSEREILVQFAEKHSLTMSEVVRAALEKMIGGNNNG